jgi:hypothetical protein
MQDHVSHQSDSSKIPPQPNVPLKVPAKCADPSRNGNPKAKSHRITVRVPDDIYEALMASSLGQGCGLSHVLRSALNGSLKPEMSPNEVRKLVMWPEEIEPHVHHYRAVVDEDIRKARKRLFGHLLAVSVACKEKFPRTEGILEGHQSLLTLQHLFGYGENV